MARTSYSWCVNVLDVCRVPPEEGSALLPGFVSEFLSQVVAIVWGMPLVFLLMFGGLGLFVFSGFMPLRGFAHAIRLVMGKFSEQEKKAEGQISHFQALATALAATVGLGNISGVAVALTQGGPGAVFWMWMAALVGMNTKFFECTLAVMYRGHDHNGEVQGGPMYVISKAMPGWFKPAALMFAICGLVGTTELFNVNQLTSFLHTQYGIDRLTVGILSAIFVAYVIMGGIRRIGFISSLLVPSMCVLYVVGSMIVILMNYEKVPGLFALIFRDAFTGEAMFGGALGYAFLQVMNVGVKRAAFSNEAGIGTAPMAHGNAKTNEPVSEGLVAMLGPFLDTIVVCTMTAMVILISIPYESFQGIEGITLTVDAFEKNWPGFGKHFLGVVIFLFSVTTMIGMANYNEKCWNFLFRGRWGLGKNTFTLYFCATLVFGAVIQLEDVINIMDIGFGLMAYPNMIATLWLAPKVKDAMVDYFKRMRL